MAVKGVAGRPGWHADGGRRHSRAARSCAGASKVVQRGGGIAKLEFYNNLRKVPEVAEDGVRSEPTGFVHLPKVDAEYLQQLCAEQLVTGATETVTRCANGRRCASATKPTATVMPGRRRLLPALDRFEERHWRELERQIGFSPPGDPDPQIEATH